MEDPTQNNSLSLASQTPSPAPARPLGDERVATSASMARTEAAATLSAGGKTRISPPSGGAMPGAMEVVHHALDGSKEHGKMVKQAILEKRVVQESGSGGTKKVGVAGPPTSRVRAPPKETIPIRAVVSDMMRDGASDPNVVSAVAEIALHALEEHHGMRDIEEYCCFVLWELCRRDKKNRDILIKAGAPAKVCAAMRADPMAASVQERGCVVLWTLALVASHRTAVVEVGGCEVVVAALKNHGGIVAVVDAALGAMKPVSIVEAGRRALEAAGAAEVVADAMIANASSENVQTEGCSVISNLAVDVANNCVTATTPRQMAAVLGAMMEHPTNPSVQRQGCFVLKNFTFSDDNVKMLAEHELPADDLLDHALGSCPDCKADAEVTVARLQEYKSTRVQREAEQQYQRTQSQLVDEAAVAAPGEAEPQQSAGAVERGIALADELLKNAILSGERGEYESALSQLEVSLKMKSRIYGPGAANNNLVHTLNCMGYVCALTGDFSGAVARYEESLAMQRQLLASPDSVASTMTDIATLLVKVGDYEGAERYLLSALDEQRSAHGSLGDKASRTVENLGDLHRLRGNAEVAERYYINAVACYKSSPEAEVQMFVSDVVSKLAGLAGSQGRSDVALRRYEMALHLKRHTYGEDAANADLVNALNSLGYARALNGCDLDAVSAYEESIGMQRSIARDDDETVFTTGLVDTHTSLGVLYLKLGDPTAARDNLEIALCMKRDMFGVDEEVAAIHRGGFAALLKNLAEACALEDDQEGAEGYYLDALEFLPPKEAADVNVALGNLACERGDYVVAREHFSSALDAAGVPKADLISILNRLGQACALLQEHSHAIDKYELSLKMQVAECGPNEVREEIASTLNSVGQLHKEKGSLAAARKHLEESLDMRRQLHKEYGTAEAAAACAETLCTLADIHRQVGHHGDAVSCLEEALAALDSIPQLTNKHVSNMARINADLGILEGMRGDVFAAQDCFQDVLNLKRALYEPDAKNLDLAETLSQLGYIFALAGNYGDALEAYEEALEMQEETQRDSGEDTYAAETRRTMEVLRVRC